MTLDIFSSNMASIGKSVILAIVFLCFVGFFHPLKIIPLLLFSVAWKLSWLIGFVIPAYLAGDLDELSKNILIPVSIGLIFTAAVIPWKYVTKTYLTSANQ